jgi:hydrogenase maturation protease
MDTLVIGCGNILRGDDAVGPMLVRRMCDRGLPEGMRCGDAGTAGIDVAFMMRNADELILVDACSTGSEPGSIFELPENEVAHLPTPATIDTHALRWDHALAFGRLLLKEEYPARVTVYLVEGERFVLGTTLSPAVDAAVDRLVDLFIDRLGRGQRGGA